MDDAQETLVFEQIALPTITDATVAKIPEGKIYRFHDGGNVSYLFVPASTSSQKKEHS
jgi:hypothetical protein